MKPTPEELMRAHQYLYYVTCSPVLSDWDYDVFCKEHGLFGGGGSDLERDYSEETKALARKLSNPS